MIEAREVCSAMNVRDVYTWTMLLSGYLKQGNPNETLNLFQKMLEDRVEPSNVTFVCVLKASTLCVSHDLGKVIHASIVERGLEEDIFVGTSLIDMYAKCGSLENANHVFLKLPIQNTVSWTSMIAGYTRHGLASVALELFWKMQHNAVAPNEVTFANALTASSLIASLEEGQLIHDMVLICGFESDCFVGNSVIDMYSSCGCMDCAYHAFKRMAKRDLVSWNLMISGYLCHGMCKQAMLLFHEMVERKVRPDKTTFLSALKACSLSQDIREGQKLHDYIQRSGVKLDVVLGSALMNMFVKCGSIENAQQVFKVLQKRDVVTWTTLMSGFVSHGDPGEALRLFKLMKQHKVLPDRLTFVGVLSACASLGDLDMGEKIHDDIICAGLECDVCLGSCLVDMYAKCGSLHKALAVFDALPKKDVIAYNALVVGYAQHGDQEGLKDIFRQMFEADMELDNVTYLSIFLAFSHCGLLDEGCRLLMFMMQECNRVLRSEHFSCIIDLLSRGGHLKDAVGFVERMPFQPCSGVWTSVLGACKIYYDIDIAKFVVEMIQELELQNSFWNRQHYSV